jgi:hypothetical protein
MPCPYPTVFHPLYPGVSFPLAVRWAEEVHYNIVGLLPVFMKEARFYVVEETSCYRTVTGALTLYRAFKAMGNSMHLHCKQVDSNVAKNC